MYTGTVTVLFFLIVFLQSLSAKEIQENPGSYNNWPAPFRRCIEEFCSALKEEELDRCLEQHCDAIALGALTKRWLDNTQFLDKRWLDSSQFVDKKWLDSSQFVDKKWLDSSQFVDKKRWPSGYDNDNDNDDQKVDKKWLDSSQFVDKKWLDSTSFLDKRNTGKLYPRKRWLDRSNFLEKRWLDRSNFIDKKNANRQEKKWLDSSSFLDKRWLDRSNFLDKRGLDYDPRKRWLDSSQFVDKRWLDNSQYIEKRSVDAQSDGDAKVNKYLSFNDQRKIKQKGSNEACVLFCKSYPEVIDCKQKCEVRHLPAPPIILQQPSPTPTKKWVDRLNYGLNRKRSPYMRFSDCFKSHCSRLKKVDYSECVRNTCMPMLVTEGGAGEGHYSDQNMLDT